MSKNITPDPYPWKKEYELNNELFDTQTKKFLEIINAMKELVATGIEEKGISEVFYQLVHYFERYMLREEMYLTDLSYDDLDKHKISHKEFMDRIIIFREEFEKGKKDFNLDMYNYLEKWFDDHMMVDDRTAVDFISERRKDK